jgi:Family of unknown function (DUF6152)
MRQTLRLSVMTSIAVLALSAFAFAHHGNAAYDAENMKTVSGTATDFQFVNPHVIIAMDVKDPATGKTVNWRGELTSPNHLERAGWSKNTIKPGDQLTMTGSALKNGEPAMAIRKIMKDGQQISTGGGE